MKPLRIALLTHSTNPRGGVAHALALGEALHDFGHLPTVLAPALTGRGFHRSVRCSTRIVPAAPVEGTLLRLVERRVHEYVAFFHEQGGAYDIYHAQDGISANALATLKARGIIDGFVRTVHHLDEFPDSQLAELQDRSVCQAQTLVCVSQLWADHINRRYSRPATVIPNGVDTLRFSPTVSPADAQMRQRLGIQSGPLLLSVGGVEERKNSIRVLQAFARVHDNCPSARLVIAGGASLLDHGKYRAAFDEAMGRISEAARSSVIQLGVVADEDMPALMRLADVVVFPSIREGFGLVVLEAMACRTPVVVSRIAPFTEYLADGDCAWCDPGDVDSIADAIRLALRKKRMLRERGFAVAGRFPWSAAARRHEGTYHSILQEKIHATDAVSSAMA